MKDQTKGAKLVSSALLGLDGETCVVGGKVYFMYPPTMKKITGCGHYLSTFGKEESVADFMRKAHSMEDCCKALSWLLVGDESVAEQLAEGTLDEVLTAIEVGLSLIGTKNFPRLSTLSRNVASLIAKPRP